MTRSLDDLRDALASAGRLELREPASEARVVEREILLADLGGARRCVGLAASVTSAAP